LAYRVRRVECNLIKKGNGGGCHEKKLVKPDQKRMSCLEEKGGGTGRTMRENKGGRRKRLGRVQRGGPEGVHAWRRYAERLKYHRLGSIANGRKRTTKGKRKLSAMVAIFSKNGFLPDDISGKRRGA